MTEVRTTSATGGQKGVKPQRYDLLPKPALDAIAEVFDELAARGAERARHHRDRHCRYGCYGHQGCLHHVQHCELLID